MSMPQIPDIKPEIRLKRRDVLNMLLSSVAMEEMSLSHLLNAESEKLRKIAQLDRCSLSEWLEINDSVERVMRNVIKNQMLLQFKLEDIIRLEKMSAEDEDGGEE